MKTPKLDISLAESYNVYYLNIKDISEYDSNWNITTPSCEITVPGFPKVNVPFTPKSENFYKSSQLNLTCDEDTECIPLPDGIYTVKYSVHPNALYFIEKSFMRVNAIRCTYGEAFLKVDFSSSCNKEEKAKDKSTLKLISILIEGSVAAANDCDCEKAYKWYNKAKQMLDNFHKEGCGCH